MRRVRVFVILGAALVGLLAAAAELPANPIYWSADRPLSWIDFQAAPPPGIETTNFVAQPFLTLSWEASYVAKGDGVTATAVVASLTVTNSLDPSLSWVLRSRVDDHVLRHEQLHFDLQEVYRRLLEITLRSITVTRSGSAAACRDALDAVVDSTGSSILARARAADAMFETETAHGENLQAQASWENQIAYLLLSPTAAP